MIFFKSQKFLLIVMFIGCIQLHALSDAAKLDMLKMKLTQQLKAEQYPNALTTMQELKALNINLPSSFTYFEGKVLYETGSHSAAYDKLEQYVNDNGSNGKYYQQALAYLIKVEVESKKLKEQVPEAKSIFGEFTYSRDLLASKKVNGRKRKAHVADWSMPNECQIEAEIARISTDSNSGLSFTTRIINLASITSMDFRDRNKRSPTSVIFNGANVSLPVDYLNKSEKEKEAFRNAMMILKKNAINRGCQ